ncbi:ester cyclase [Nocardia gamkensis]|uniref:ester cyclase n=1 Tax=Nocardia gamkensis TaxID=352869 RepID=UPI0033D01ADE
MASAKAEADPVDERQRIRDLRAEIVVRHAHSENVHEFETTLDTFTHPHYELIPTGQQPDTRQGVDEYYHATRATFPDQRNTEMVLRHADDAVIAEFFLEGTMQGSLQGLPPTGKRFRLRTVAIFVFEHDTANLINERCYFDLYSMLQQLGLLPIALAAGVAMPKAEIPIDANEPGVFSVDTR